MAIYGFIYDEASGAYLSSEEAKTSSVSENLQGEALPQETVFQQREAKVSGPDRGPHLGASEALHTESSVRSDSKNGREEIERDKDSNTDSKMWLSSSARMKDSPVAARRRDEAVDLRQLEESATPAKVPVPSSYYSKSKIAATPSKIPVVSGHTPQHAAVTASEAKTPLSKHGGYSSSGNGGPSGLPVCVPPSPPAQSVLQTPLVIGENSSSSSRGKSASQAKGAIIAQTPLSPGPLPSNMNKQQRGYVEYLNDDADSNPTSINKQSQLDNRVNRFDNGSTPSAQSFLGSYRVPEAVWARGLQLSVESLLTHASDSQVRTATSTAFLLIEVPNVRSIINY